MKRPVSWWQQVSGEAIIGPLKGTKLRSIDTGRVDVSVCGRKKNRMVGCSNRILRSLRTTTLRQIGNNECRKSRVASVHIDQTLPPRTLVVGLTIGNASKAYPFDALVKQSPIIDDVAGVPIVAGLGQGWKIGTGFRKNGRRSQARDVYQDRITGLCAGSMLKPEVNGISLARAINGQLERATVEKDSRVERLLV